MKPIITLALTLVVGVSAVLAMLVIVGISTSTEAIDWWYKIVAVTGVITIAGLVIAVLAKPKS